METVSYGIGELKGMGVGDDTVLANCHFKCSATCWNPRNRCKRNINCCVFVSGRHCACSNNHTIVCENLYYSTFT